MATQPDNNGLLVIAVVDGDGRHKGMRAARWSARELGRVVRVTVRPCGHRPPPPFWNSVISVDRRVISVDSRVVSVDPRGN